MDSGAHHANLGDPLECCNYRGITVGVALAKLYAIVLNKRLRSIIAGLRPKPAFGKTTDVQIIISF